jgi:tungstate transport system ATP-binding protein
MSPAQPLLTVRGLRVQLDGRTLLNIDQWTVHAGEAQAITGDNGAGKTTLLKIVAGLEPATPRSLEFGGQVLTQPILPRDFPQAWRRRMVYVHQQPYMLQGSVRHNVAYALRAWGLPAAETEARISAALQWARLAALASRNAQVLSGGERQRLALARVHALAPDLWLLDEPTANLDGASREGVIELIAQLTASGVAVVVVSHDRDLLARAQFKRYTLQDGQLLDRSSGSSDHRSGT